MWEDRPFVPHPNLSDEINNNISLSEIEGGVHLSNMAVGTKLSVTTQNRVYTIERRRIGFWVSGHPEFCPVPIFTCIAGSTWGGSMLKMKFIGIGMHMEFRPAGCEWIITTSKIRDVTKG
jgi:hypothetical protein